MPAPDPVSARPVSDLLLGPTGRPTLTPYAKRPLTPKQRATINLLVRASDDSNQGTGRGRDFGDRVAGVTRHPDLATEDDHARNAFEIVLRVDSIIIT